MQSRWVADRMHAHPACALVLVIVAGALAVVSAGCADDTSTGGGTCPDGMILFRGMCVRRGEPTPTDGGTSPMLDASATPTPTPTPPTTPTPVPPTPPIDGAPSPSDASVPDVADMIAPPPDSGPVAIDAGPVVTGRPCAGEDECFAWAYALFDALNEERARVGCETPLVWDPRVAGVATEDAQEMADSDSLMGGLEDIYMAVRDAGVDPASMSSFAGTARTMPTDPLGRWLENPEPASRLRDCAFDSAGAGFATTAGGTESFGRLLVLEN